MITNIDHVQLAMPAGGEDLAVAFYEAILGLPLVPKPPHPAKRGGCWFESSTVKIHLGVEEAFRPARKAHPGLLVAGLAGLVDRLELAGYPVRSEEPLEDYNRVYVNDPFGNRLELLSPPIARTVESGAGLSIGTAAAAGGGVFSGRRGPVCRLARRRAPQRSSPRQLLTGGRRSGRVGHPAAAGRGQIITTGEPLEDTWANAEHR